MELSCLDLPSQAGAFNIADGLSVIQRRQYEDIDSLVIEPHLWRDVPKAFHRVRARDEGALQSALADSELAAVTPEDELLTGLNDKPVEGCLLCAETSEAGQAKAASTDLRQTPSERDRTSSVLGAIATCVLISNGCLAKGVGGARVW